MSTYTIKDISDTTGVSKATIKRRAIELGIYEKMQVIGGRNTRVMTTEQASMLTDAVQKLNPRRDAAVNEGIRQHTNTLYREHIELLKGQIDAQNERMEQMRTDYDAACAGYQEDIQQLQAELHAARACIMELAAAHWWQKRAIVARYALPPAGQN